MLGRIVGVALVPLCLCAQSGSADELLSYSNLSSREKLHSQVALFLGSAGASVKADLTVEGQNGVTRVLPRVTSRFSSGDWLDVSSVLTYGDWNSPAAAEPSVATKILLRSTVPFVRQVEGTVRRGTSEAESLRIGFADWRLDSFGGRTVNVRSALTLGGDGAGSSFSSVVALGPSLDFSTVRHLAADGYDTKLVYRPESPVVEQVVAGLKRTPNGELAQSIGVRFPEVLRGADYGPPLKVTSGATLEETLAPNGIATVRMGFETSVAGLRPSLLGGTSRLSLKLEQPLDAALDERASFAYDHAWAPHDETSIAVNLKMLREADQVEPSLGVSWRSRF